ncbi:MAG: proline racemase family protein [Acidobacteriota bacterium]
MNAKRVVTTIDTHTAGGPTRTVVAGLPQLRGESVAEKMEYFRTHFDSIRKMLMLEPRGHKDMAGAVLTAAADPSAATGAFFLTSGGYLRACVHSSIGLVTAGLETGFITHDASGAGDSIKLEVPAGIVSAIPHYQGNKVASVAIRIPPAFSCSGEEQLQLDSATTLPVALAYSGVFFVLVNARDLPLSNRSILPQEAKKLAQLSVEILSAANRQFAMSHPENPSINSFELVMIYEELGNRHTRDIVVGRTGSIDRSPCGAGTGALITHLFALGRLPAGEDYLVESFLGTKFTGRIIGPAKVGSYTGAVPEIEGSAYLTGMHQFLLDSEDPLPEGLSF